jgi:formate-dependent nitrite reductase membrane component NrfD
MIEEVLVTPHYNPMVGPSLGIWDWRVAVYLFLGGLTAGLMLLWGATVLLKRQEECPFAAYGVPLWAPILLSLGMFTLFLDLEHKLFVFRFYTTFELTSPMSWGSWILALVYPITFLMIAATLRKGYPKLAKPLERLPFATALLNFSERRRATIAAWGIPVAVALGIYTGVLLSAFNARPYWNTSILGPLFLISGLSTAAAFVLLGCRCISERLLYARVDVGLILAELVLVALLVIGLTTGARVQLEAADLILGGPYTVVFWALFVGAGLLIPLALEFMEGSGGGRAFAVLAAMLVLFGGYMLRGVTVELGQTSAWNKYETQYNPALLERLQE